MVKITKTTNPIHFEDLDPHRFEDLVRELAYDFKDWQSIEATGKGGSDDGYDIRAWEKITEITNKNEDDENDEGAHPMEGNLWMIQCKREKELGPKEISKIITSTITKNSAPYGYILVASVNFSKKAYDTFREELKKRGVMEFHLWGKAELEDMLHMPKNDRILFTFFGISLVVKKRNKTTQIKFGVNNKNKLIRVLGEATYHDLHKSVLIRDYEDKKYPFKDEYEDFEKYPRWREHIAVGYHPLGLNLNLRKFYAYVDTVKKEYDITPAIDLINREKDRKDGAEHQKLRRRVEDFYEHLPKENQATFLVSALLTFEDMLIIDDKGDVLYSFPHIYIDDKKYGDTPYRGLWEEIEKGDISIGPQKEGYKKISIFPKVFPKMKKGKVHIEKTIDWNKEEIKEFVRGIGTDKLFDVDNKYPDIEVRDFIPLKKDETDQYAHQQYIEITHKYETLVKDYLQDKIPYAKEQLEKQVGRAVKDGEKLTIFEIRVAYEWRIQEKDE